MTMSRKQRKPLTEEQKAARAEKRATRAANRSALDVALTMLGRRDFSVSEIVEKLKNRNYSQDEITRTVEKLLSYNYLNDERYANQFVSARCRLRGWGPKRVALDLKKRGVSEDLIAQAIRLWQNEGDDGKGVDWAEQAAGLLERKFGYWQQLEPKEKNRRLNFLLRRGYGMGVCLRALELTYQEE